MLSMIHVYQYNKQELPLTMERGSRQKRPCLRTHSLTRAGADAKLLEHAREWMAKIRTQKSE
jgi:hypothetical protein